MASASTKQPTPNGGKFTSQRGEFRVDNERRQGPAIDLKPKAAPAKF